MTNHEPDPERQEQIASAVAKVIGVALALGLVIGLGTWVLVKAVGLDSVESTGVPIRVDPITPSALPTSALPQPTQTAGPGSDSPEEPTFSVNPGKDNLLLNASPLFVESMERINLTGQWPGRDAVSLLVQRFEDGEWVDFGVQTRVKIGTYETFVLTGRGGDNKFRVFEPDSGTASNTVTVTVED